MKAHQILNDFRVKTMQLKQYWDNQIISSIESWENLTVNKVVEIQEICWV